VGYNQKIGKKPRKQTRLKTTFVSRKTHKPVKMSSKAAAKVVTNVASTASKTVKQKIPKALREQVWLQHMGKKFEGKCRVSWCTNIITVFDWEAGHNIPESKGGETTLQNLRPICSRCNKSMGDQYSIDQWNELGRNKKKPKQCCGCCIS